MAIDTAPKRRSAAGFRRHPGVTPNASKDAPWRAQAGRVYSGIAFVSAVFEEIECVIDVPWDVLCKLMVRAGTGQAAVLRAAPYSALLPKVDGAVHKSGQSSVTP